MSEIWIRRPIASSWSSARRSRPPLEAGSLDRDGRLAGDRGEQPAIGVAEGRRAGRPARTTVPWWPRAVRRNAARIDRTVAAVGLDLGARADRRVLVMEPATHERRGRRLQRRDRSGPPSRARMSRRRGRGRSRSSRRAAG